MAPVSSSLEKSSRPPGSLVVPLPAEQEAGINTQAWGGVPFLGRVDAVIFFKRHVSLGATCQVRGLRTWGIRTLFIRWS